MCRSGYFFPAEWIPDFSLRSPSNNSESCRVIRLDLARDMTNANLQTRQKPRPCWGSNHHPVTVTAESLWNAFENSVTAVEEPLGSTSVLPMWHLAKRAREDVTVVLTGQGSDEPWGGYRRYQAEIWRDRLPFPALLALLDPVLRPLPKVPEFLLRAVASIPLADRAQRFEQAYALYFPSTRRELTGTSEAGYAADAIHYWLNWLGPNRIPAVEAMMAIDTRMGLADDLLLYGDKISMAIRWRHGCRCWILTS
jgi:asparagine synthase (glutamine-hydrolysing)